MKAVLLLSVLTITFGLVVGYSEFDRRAFTEPNETNETDDLNEGCRGKNDVWYKVGTSFPARDGCNRCYCKSGASKEYPDGRAGCTRMGCGPWTRVKNDLNEGCQGKDNVWYKVGTSFPARDGCNRCKCFRGASKEHPEGEAGCTRKGCGPWTRVKNVAAPRRVYPEPNETNETDDSSEGCRDVENDVWYKVGTSFPARDGCNSCYCVRGASKERPDGLARCTIVGCGP